MDWLTLNRQVTFTVTGAPMRVFHLETNPADCERVHRELLRTQPDLEWVSLTTRAAFLAALDEELPVLVLTERSLPDLDGLEALDLLRIRTLTVPFIFVSGSAGEELAIDTLKSGATDYVLKSRLSRLGPAVRHALTEMWAKQERELAERALDAQRRLLRTLVDAIPDAIYAVDERGRLTMANLALLREARFTTAEALGRPLSDLPLPPALAAEAVSDEALLGGDANEVFRERADPQRDGSLRWRATTKALLREAHSDEVTGLVSITRDVTRPKELERELLDISGREQRRLGSDLHDDIGQQLSGILMMMGALKRDIARVAPELVERIEQLHQLQRAALESVRTLARGLCPVELSQGGLPIALEGLVRQFIHLPHPVCRLEVSGGAPSGLTDEAAVHLFRIAQEALSNAVKHSGASTVLVHLQSLPGLLQLEVTDDGQGMTLATIPAGHRDTGLGLQLMRYRAQMVGAELEFLQTRPGTERTGTRVLLSLALRKNAGESPHAHWMEGS
jgi:PAS domain S-box-containing protein